MKTSRIRAALAALLLGLGLAVAVSSPASADNPWLGPVRIISSGDSKCLDVAGVSQSNGALLQLYDCLPNQWNQQFYFYAAPGFQTYQIVPRHSWKCLDVVGASQATGAAVQQYDCLGFDQLNQIWQMIYCCNNAYFQLVPVHSWKPMTYVGPLGNGTSVVQCCTHYWIWSSYLG